MPLGLLGAVTPVASAAPLGGGPVGMHASTGVRTGNAAVGALRGGSPEPTRHERAAVTEPLPPVPDDDDW